MAKYHILRVAKGTVPNIPGYSFVRTTRQGDIYRKEIPTMNQLAALFSAMKASNAPVGAAAPVEVDEAQLEAIVHLPDEQVDSALNQLMSGLRIGGRRRRGRKSTRKSHRKGSRKAHRKGSRKAHRKSRKNY